MKLVMLAAGHSRRFNALKQLAPVGPGGEAIMDYTVTAALGAGFDGVVLVLREEIRDEVVQHVASYWPSQLSFEVVCQVDQLGTVPAVLAAAPLLDGPFAVANADDLYDGVALGLVAAHLEDPATVSDDDSPHVLIGYQLVQTVLTDAAVKRGICVLGHGGRLEQIVEHVVQLRRDGGFDAVPLDDAPASESDMRLRLTGAERVSMNLWGFQPRVLDELAAAAACARAQGVSHELLLPTVIGDLVAAGRETIVVKEAPGRCIGLTHAADLGLVQAELAAGPVSEIPSGFQDRLARK